MAKIRKFELMNLFDSMLTFEFERETNFFFISQYNNIRKMRISKWFNLCLPTKHTHKHARVKLSHHANSITKNSLYKLRRRNLPSGARTRQIKIHSHTSKSISFSTFDPPECGIVSRTDHTLVLFYYRSVFITSIPNAGGGFLFRLGPSFGPKNNRIEAGGQKSFGSVYHLSKVGVCRGEMKNVFQYLAQIPLDESDGLIGNLPLFFFFFKILPCIFIGIWKIYWSIFHSFFVQLCIGKNFIRSKKLGRQSTYPPRDNSVKLSQQFA